MAPESELFSEGLRLVNKTELNNKVNGLVVAANSPELALRETLKAAIGKTEKWHEDHFNLVYSDEMKAAEEALAAAVRKRVEDCGSDPDGLLGK